MRTGFVGVVIGGLAAGIVGCASPGSSSSAPPSPLATATGLAVAPEFAYTCGGDPFTLDLFTLPGVAELDPHPSAGALRALLAGPDMETDFLPDSGWYLAGRDATRASFVAPVAGDPPFVEAVIENGPDGWRPAGWGQCRPRLALDGLSAATWILDPAEAVPGPETTTFTALVTETDCASGRPPGDRLQPPEVFYGTEEVVVIFAVRPQAGNQDCQGNPSTAVTVELSEPLGERRLLDGGVFPLHDPAEPWPPP